VIDDYPSGFKARCRKRVWLEFKAKQGWRLVSQTSEKWYPGEEPEKDAVLRWNKPDASTYAPIAACMYLDGQDHVQWDALGWGTSSAKVLEFFGDYPQADFGAVKVFAAQRIKELLGSLLGKTVMTMNGQPRPDSDHELGEKRKELETWADIAKKVGLHVPAEAQDLIDGKVEPKQFDPEAFAQSQKLRQEKIDEAKAQAANSAGALNGADFGKRIRSKAKMKGWTLDIDEPNQHGSIGVWFHDGSGGRSVGSRNTQVLRVLGFDRAEVNRAVAKVKVETINNSIVKGGDRGSYGENMAARKELLLRAKTGTPEKVADYIAAHINEVVDEIQSGAKTASGYDRRRHFAVGSI
jgi:hypothetical protein